MDLSLLGRAVNVGHDASQEQQQDQDLQEVVALFQRGQFEDVLLHPLVATILIRSVTPAEGDDSSVRDVFEARAHKFCDESSSPFTALVAAAASIQLFRHLNWCGPTSLGSKLPDLKSANEEIMDALMSDGELLVPTVLKPELLLLARSILFGCETDLSEYKTFTFWKLRVCILHQRMIESFCATLSDDITALVPVVVDQEFWLKNELAEQRALMLVECGLIRHFYRHGSFANEMFEDARQLVGLKVEMGAALGKRTKFQKKALPQLLLNVSQKELPSSGAVDHATDTMPKNITLDDDTLLEQTKFSEDDDKNQEILSPVSQAFVLSLCLDVKNKNPKHGLTTEEMVPYARHVLATPKSWAVQFVALLLRSKLELERSRTVMRALLQIQELNDAIDRDTPDAATRAYLLPALNFPPRWELQLHLAEVYKANMMPREALDLFLGLGQWHDVIDCYHMLEQKGKAEEVVRARLAIKETPLLWCALGEVMQDEQYFDKAWELSKHKLTRAVRSQGRMLVMRAEAQRHRNVSIEELTPTYEKAVDCLEKAVKLNVLQPGVWFMLGCAAQRIGKFETVVRAFRYKVEQDPDDFESWNNLAEGYIKLKQKPKAFLALQEAVKHAYENWKVWENLSWVAVDVGAFRECMLAITRLLDIRGKFNDWEVLRILVHSVVTGIEDSTGASASALKDRLKTLADKIRESPSIQDFRVGIELGRAYAHCGEYNTAQDCRKNAYQTAKSAVGWEKDDKHASAVADSLIAVVTGTLDEKDEKGIRSGRLMCRSVMKALEQSVASGYDSERKTELLTELKDLNERIEAVIASSSSSSSAP